MDEMEFQNTELWKLFTEKNQNSTPDNAALLENEVKTVCEYGINLSKTIRDTFQTYTLHDETHICNVMKNMLELLGDHKNKLTRDECIMLIMSACCHDIGMSADEEEKNYLRSGCDPMIEYLEKHPSDYNIAYGNKENMSPNITDVVLQHYIRANHHKRVREQLEKLAWPRVLGSIMSVDDLIAVCQSHGEDAEEIRKLQRFTPALDLYLCAVLLRLGDILDFDATRAPDTLYHYINLAHLDGVEYEKSRREWEKHQASRGFSFVDDEQAHLLYRAECSMIQIEQAIEAYLDWVDEELTACGKMIRYMEVRWRTLLIPNKVERKIEAKGYLSGEYKITLDQERVLDLLVGREIYNDPAIFVRELIQNAIDAVRTRKQLDKNLPHDWEPQIKIRTWIDDEGFSWFRIEDNGIGMTEEMIQKYFLRVGHSYYSSQQFGMDKHRNEADPDYKPISRFGIGILSCFMGDTKNNRVEVTTKHFKEEGVRYPAYRLSIQGLNGYYYLANDEKHRTTAFIMPDASKTNQRFISEPGTIIAVRTNIYQAEGYHTFKDIIDKYVVFPEVPIRYEGTDCICDYKTEQEFLNEIHNLVPKDNENNYQPVERIPISDENFQKLEQEYPEIVWEEKPNIAIYCLPLDYFIDSNLIKGVTILAQAEGKGSWVDENLEGDFKPQITLYLTVNSWGEEGNVCVLVHVFEEEKLKKLEERVLPGLSDYLSQAGINISGKSEYQLEETIAHLKTKSIPGISDSELRVFTAGCSRFTWSFSTKVLEEFEWYRSVAGEHFKRSEMERNIRDNSTSVNAHNGILIDNSDIISEIGVISKSILMLKDEYCPQLNLSRNRLQGLPFEATVFMNILVDRISYTLKNTLLGYRNSYSWTEYKSAKEYIEVMEKFSFPELHFKTNRGALTKEEIKSRLTEKIFVSRMTNSELHLAMLMKYFDLKIDFSGPEESCIVVLEKGTVLNFDKFLSFPPALILPAISEDELHLTHKTNRYYRWNYTIYNVNNVFSRWMIQNQGVLQEKVPGIYQQLIKCLLYPNEFMDNINAILKHLRQIPKLGIEIAKDLTEDDFIQLEGDE